MSIHRLLAQKLADKGVVLTPKHNTIFTALSEYGRRNKVVEQAITGLALDVKADINMFRNVILPASQDIESAVRSRSALTPKTIADKVTTHVYQYQDGLDLVTELDIIDQGVNVRIEALPTPNLRMGFDKSIIDDNLKNGNSRVRSKLEEILLEYEDDFLENFHTKVFGGLSRNNTYLSGLCASGVRNHNELTLALILTTSYISGTLGVSNLPADKVRGEYLYTLRNALVTSLTYYRNVYQSYIDSGVLIIGTKVVDGVTRISLVGENYQKYLDSDNTIDPIIGYASATPDGHTLTTEAFLEGVDRYQAIYDQAMRLASMSSAVESIKALRLAYKLVTREYLNDLPEGTLDRLDIDHEGLIEINQLVAEYVDGLSADEVLDIVAVTRHITGLYIYNKSEFISFVGYMTYYNKMFPKLDIESIATTAMVAHMMDKLEPQLVTSVG